MEFKENLQVLLISSLFVLLAARIPLETLTKVGSAHVLFLLVLIVIGRPLSILASTLFSNTNWKERAFLAMLAPRGIVAAAVASIFALELEEIHHPAAETLVPIVFFVIVGSVLIYGLSATPLARKLGLADQNPQGVLFIGANPVSMALAKLIKEKGFRVMLLDTNWNNVRSARAQELPVLQGNILTERTMEELDLEGIGKVFAMTPNSEINTLSLIHLTHVFTRERAYQLPGDGKAGTGTDASSSFQHRTLFSKDLGFQGLSQLLSQGASIKSTKLSKEFDSDKFKAENGERAKVLAVISESGLFEPVTTDYKPKMKAGASLIYLLLPEEVPIQE
ncbi:MAG: cation:proton antiporter [Fimbriimonadaceae bacterium]